MQKPRAETAHHQCWECNMQGSKVKLWRYEYLESVPEFHENSHCRNLLSVHLKTLPPQDQVLSALSMSSLKHGYQHKPQLWLRDSVSAFPPLLLSFQCLDFAVCPRWTECRDGWNSQSGRDPIRGIITCLNENFINMELPQDINKLTG